MSDDTFVSHRTFRKIVVEIAQIHEIIPQLQETIAQQREEIKELKGQLATIMVTTHASHRGSIAPAPTPAKITAYPSPSPPQYAKTAIQVPQQAAPQQAHLVTAAAIKTIKEEKK